MVRSPHVRRTKHHRHPQFAAWMRRRARPRLPHAAQASAVASLRNLAIGILRALGHRNIAAALRRNVRDATRVLPLLGITSP